MIKICNTTCRRNRICIILCALYFINIWRCHETQRYVCCDFLKTGTVPRKNEWKRWERQKPKTQNLIQTITMTISFVNVYDQSVGVNTYKTTTNSIIRTSLWWQSLLRTLYPSSSWLMHKLSYNGTSFFLLFVSERTSSLLSLLTEEPSL